MIRPLDPTDGAVAARIVEIQRAAYKIESELIGYDGIPQLGETIDDVIARDDLEWLGAFEGEQLVGVVACSLDDGMLDIDRLAVDPDHLRRGHGYRLVEALPFRRRVVVTTGAMNVPARRMYERLGFTLTREFEVAPGVRMVAYERGPAVAENLTGR